VRSPFITYTQDGGTKHWYPYHFINVDDLGYGRATWHRTSPHCGICWSPTASVNLYDDRLVVSVNSTGVGDLAASVNRAAFGAGMVLVQLRPLRTTLEDGYLAMVHGAAR